MSPPNGYGYGHGYGYGNGNGNGWNGRTVMVQFSLVSQRPALVLAASLVTRKKICIFCAEADKLDDVCPSAISLSLSVSGSLLLSTSIYMGPTEMIIWSRRHLRHTLWLFMRCIRSSTSTTWVVYRAHTQPVSAQLYWAKILGSSTYY